MKYLFAFIFLIFTQCFIAQNTSTKIDEYIITVSKDGSADFKTIQEAINASPAFPYKRVTILIKNGFYKEKVKIPNCNPMLSLVGESSDKTIISFDDNFKKINLGRNSTFYTPTLSVEADEILIKNLTIENTSGEVGQAIALSITATKVKVENCKILGFQDTLYAAGNGKQYFKNCFISGGTDFIFGNATAFFENCEILNKTNSFTTAASTSENAEFGFVFSNCKILAENGIDKVFLGRPWRIFAKTVYLNCDLGKQILSEGWNNWNKPDAEKASFYAEYNNKGAGSKIDKRANWSHQLTKIEAEKYTLKNVLGDIKLTNSKQWYENF
ncbi:pectinesterase family protein [Halpernia frigidisoli]|uniref:Pectinesterase n=1 Tax=Halpernia frigidisoli TaxID=1125876 RepID=A0A1I3IVM2_9FLAO|nr:pectinesterase family protein [Halpernia frigidisoli]SFI51981.1 pectinesterase [Halpernia frigidisoli]